MKPLRSMTLIAFCLALLAMAMTVRRAEAQVYNCFPTCGVTDGRFLSLVGQGLQSLAGTTMSIALTAPGSATTLQAGIFDGDTGGGSGISEQSRWCIHCTPTHWGTALAPR